MGAFLLEGKRTVEALFMFCIDLKKIRPVYRKYKGVDLKMYPSWATVENFDPFIAVIEKTGKEILLENESMGKSTGK